MAGKHRKTDETPADLARARERGGSQIEREVLNDTAIRVRTGNWDAPLTAQEQTRGQ